MARVVRRRNKHPPSSQCTANAIRQDTGYHRSKDKPILPTYIRATAQISLFALRPHQFREPRTSAGDTPSWEKLPERELEYVNQSNIKFKNEWNYKLPLLQFVKIIKHLYIYIFKVNATGHGGSGNNVPDLFSQKVFISKLGRDTVCFN